MRHFLTLILALSTFSAKAQCTDIDTTGLVPFYSLNVVPSYTDGEAEFIQFLATVPLPALEGDFDLIGKITLVFIVEADGSVQYICAADNSQHPWVQAYLQLLTEMKPWNPGELNGQAVRCKMTIPLFFQRE